jgi:hypothetical protein
MKTKLAYTRLETAVQATWWTVIMGGFVACVLGLVLLLAYGWLLLLLSFARAWTGFAGLAC